MKKIFTSPAFFVVILILNIITPAKSTENQYETNWIAPAATSPVDWESEESLRQKLVILDTLSNYIPDVTVIQQVESSCWYDRDYPNYWFAGLNNVDRWAQVAWLQVWEPPEADDPPIFRQQFRIYGNIHHMGWLEIEGEPVLYVITNIDAQFISVATFRFSDEGDSIIIGSEAIRRSYRLWMVPDLPLLGPTFIFGTSMSRPDGAGDQAWIGLMTWSGDGFFTSYEFELGDFLTDEDAEMLEISSDVETITHALRSHPDTLDSFTPYTPSGDSHLRYNLDGSSYTGSYWDAKFFGWEEIPLEEISE